MPHAAMSPPELFFLAGLCIWVSRSVWQAEEAVANLPLRLAVRGRCGHQVWGVNYDSVCCCRGSSCS
jgi:hypothetical protein